MTAPKRIPARRPETDVHPVDRVVAQTKHGETSTKPAPADSEALLPLSTRIPATLKARLRHAAYTNGTSTQAQVIAALEAHLPDLP